MIELKAILLVEDNHRDAELTMEAFAEYNLANEVVVVQDGAESLDFLFRRGAYVDRASGNPALVLLDIKMPKVDGLEVLRTIRAEPTLRTIPVVMLTSSREERDLVESYGLGVNAFVVKPVQFADFVESVKLLGKFWAIVNEPPVGSIRPR